MEELSQQESGRRHPFYALTYRNFRLFFVGQTISVVGTWMQSIALNWYVWELTHSPAWLGYVNGASAIPFVLFTVWGGQIADRKSRRSILVCTQTWMMVMAFVLAALATNRWIHAQAWHILILSTCLSVANAFNMPAQQAFVTDMVDDRRVYGNAIALNSLRFNLARFIGPILAGITLKRWGVSACFFVNGLSFIAVIISLLMMRLRERIEDNVRGSGFEGFGYIRRTPSVLRVLIMIALGAVFAWSASTLYPVFAARYHQGATGYSYIMSSNGIGAALGGLILATFGDRFPRRYQIYGGAFVFGLALLGLTVVRSFPALLGVLVISGMAMIIFGISSQTKVQEDVPDALRGRVMAVYSLVFQGMLPLGGLESGFLAESNRLGLLATVRLNAVITLVVLGAVWTWSQTERKNRSSTF